MKGKVVFTYFIIRFQKKSSERLFFKLNVIMEIFLFSFHNLATWDRNYFM